MSKLRGSLTYANVVATLALFLALGGGVVYAADKIGSGQIARDAIESKHVGANELRGGDIAEKSLRGVSVAGYERVKETWKVPPDSTLFLNAQCPSGKVAVSGGYFSDYRVDQTLSVVTGDRTYTSGIRNLSQTETATVEISAVCLQA